jgi:hypothetical protein
MNARLPSCLTLCLVVLVPGTTAAVDMTGDVNANQVELQGNVSVESALAAALSEWSDSVRTVPAASFELQAKNLLVKTFYADPEVNVDLVGAVLQAQTTEQPYTTCDLASCWQSSHAKWPACRGRRSA